MNDDNHHNMTTLLHGLTVGATRLMDSAGAWADHLGGELPSPEAVRFLDQLDAEWIDTLAPAPVWAAIGERVRRRIAAWHPGWPHLWAHVLRVTGMAVTLAEDEDVDPALAYLAGMCHDAGKLDEQRTSTPHEILGAQFAGRVLADVLPPDQIALIQAAIRRQGDHPLKHVLNDADKLDKIGAVGVVRRASVYTRAEWLLPALWRVEDDADRFPTMHFERSRALARDKRAFLRWFLPEAFNALDTNGEDEWDDEEWNGAEGDGDTGDDETDGDTT